MNDGETRRKANEVINALGGLDESDKTRPPRVIEFRGQRKCDRLWVHGQYVL